MISKLYLLQKYLNNFGFLSEAFEIEALVKFAKLTQGENTSLFEEAFPDVNPQERKGFADRFYEIFKFLKDDQMFREIISSVSSFDEIKKKIEECERAVSSVQSTVESLGLPANAANQQAKQYLYKFYNELGGSSFFNRLTSIQNRGDFFALLRTEKNKTDESKLEKYNLSADKIRGLSPKEIDWIIKVLDIAEAGGEAHSADDAISMVKIFHKERGNFDKEVWQFDSYSAAQAYLDSKSGTSEAAYMAGIESAAKSNDMSRVVFEDNRWKVVLIGSTIAGQYWRYATGADSSMCIGTLSLNLFADYSINRGIDPYFIIDKINTSGSNPMRMFTLSTGRDWDYGGEAEIQTQDDQEGFNASTMTNANNVEINISEIKETLGSKYDEIVSAILGDANSREQTLGKQNADKIDNLIRNRETALNNLEEVISYIPEYIATKNDKLLLDFKIPKITRKIAETYVRSDSKKFLKTFYNVDGFEDLTENFWNLIPTDYLDLSWSQIRELPDPFNFPGKLYISNSKITKLPDTFIVGDDFTFANTEFAKKPVSKLSRNFMEIKGNLDVSMLWAPVFPEKTIIHGDLILLKDDDDYMSGGPMTSSNESIQGYIDAYGLDHKRVKEFLEVRGEVIRKVKRQGY